MEPGKGRFSFIHSRLVKSLIFSGGVLLVFAFILLRYEGFFAGISALFKILRPPIIGVVLAIAAGAALIFILELGDELGVRITEKIEQKGNAAVFATVFAAVLFFVVFGIFRGDYIASEFIYKQF